MSKAIDLAVKLKAIFDQLNTVTADIHAIMKEEDNRNFHFDFSASTDGVSPMVMGTLLDDESKKVMMQYSLLLDVLYLKDLESLKGKGEWREKVIEQGQYRFSVDALKLLRQKHPELDIKAAKALIEGYAAGLFE